MKTPDGHRGRAGLFLARRFSALLALAVVGSVCVAQSPVEQVNAMYSDIRDSQRSDLIMLPVLADLEEPPIGASDLKSAVLMVAGSANWSRAEAWAMGEPQVAVLTALDTVTQGEDPRTSMGFGQPYGPGVPRNLIARGMYTELGDPPSLAGASFKLSLIHI